MTRVCEIEDIKNKAATYEFALIYTYSSPKYLGENNAGSIDWSELVDARFFGEEGELHVFRNEDNELEMVELSDSVEQENFNERFEDFERPLERGYGKSITIREYINFDEDGQAVVVCTRLKNYE